MRKGFWILHFKDILTCVDFDLLCGFVKLGSTFVKPSTFGVTQGSCLSMGIADYCGCFIELHFMQQLFWNSRHVITLLIRYVDDIYIRITAFGIPAKSECMMPRRRKLRVKGASSNGDLLTNDILRLVAHTRLEDILQRYERYFRVKVEDCSTFIGLALSTAEDGTLSMCADLPSHPDFRFKSSIGAKPLPKKLKVIQSQIASTFDRCLNLCPITSLSRTLRCFHHCGFSLVLIQKAIKSFLRTHPYLHVPLARALGECFPNCSMTKITCHFKLSRVRDPHE